MILGGRGLGLGGGGGLFEGPLSRFGDDAHFLAPAPPLTTCSCLSSSQEDGLPDYLIKAEEHLKLETGEEHRLSLTVCGHSAKD